MVKIKKANQVRKDSFEQLYSCNNKEFVCYYSRQNLIKKKEEIICC